MNELINSADNKKVVGTSGNDYIINTGENVTIAGGKGSDTIIGSDDYGEVFAFSSADDDNVIVNFGTGDTLRMTAGNTLSYSKSGSDYIVTMKGTNYTGTVTLSGAVEYGTLQKIGTAYVMKGGANESAELPSDDYWFESDASIDELGELIGDSDLDNSLGMLDRDDPISIASARIDRIEQITAVARHRQN